MNGKGADYKCKYLFKRSWLRSFLKETSIKIKCIIKHYILAYLTISVHMATQPIICADPHERQPSFAIHCIMEWQKCLHVLSLLWASWDYVGGIASVDNSFCVYKSITYAVDTTEQSCVIETWTFKHRHVYAYLDKRGILCQTAVLQMSVYRKTVNVLPENWSAWCQNRKHLKKKRLKNRNGKREKAESQGRFALLNCTVTSH